MQGFNQYTETEANRLPYLTSIARTPVYASITCIILMLELLLLEPDIQLYKTEQFIKHTKCKTDPVVRLNCSIVISNK